MTPASLLRPLCLAVALSGPAVAANAPVSLEELIERSAGIGITQPMPPRGEVQRVVMEQFANGDLLMRLGDGKGLVVSSQPKGAAVPSTMSLVGWVDGDDDAYATVGEARQDCSK
jgi:hypothetical protein